MTGWGLPHPFCGMKMMTKDEFKAIYKNSKKDAEDIKNIIKKVKEKSKNTFKKVKESSMSAFEKLKKISNEINANSANSNKKTQSKWGNKKMEKERKCPYCKSSNGEPKISYATEQEALSAAEHSRKREREKTGIELRLVVYTCPHGNGFHLTKERENIMIGKKIKSYTIIDKLHDFGNSEFSNKLVSWEVEDSAGNKFELLTIEPEQKFIKQIKDILTNEIEIMKKSFLGVQQLIEYDYDKENKLFYLVYEKIEDHPIVDDQKNRNTLFQLATSLERLKIKNSFGFAISPETVFITEDIIQGKQPVLKYAGLWKIFKNFKAINYDYASPKVTQKNEKQQKPQVTDDIYSMAKLYQPYLQNVNQTVYNKCTYDYINNREHYTKYQPFINDIRNLEGQSPRIVKLVTQPENEENFKNIVEEMNQECYFIFEKERSKEKDQITGRFTTEKHHGRFFIDNRNYFFIPSQGLQNYPKEEIRDEGRFFLDWIFEFVPSESRESHNIHHGIPLDPETEEKRVNLIQVGETLREETNQLAGLKIRKENLIEKWQTLPEKEKEFIEEEAFKSVYTKFEVVKNNRQNLKFYLLDTEETPINWEKLRMLKNQGIKLSLPMPPPKYAVEIGKILDYNTSDNFLIIADYNKRADISPEGTLIQDVFPETVQYKKQTEACTQFLENDMLNLNLSTIIATPEILLDQNIISVDEDEFEDRFFDSNLANDTVQRKVVLEAMYKKPLYLIQGPPGTGKTTVIVELVRQLLEENSTTKILITSQSNLAVDNVLERLPQEEVSFVRLASENAIERDRISEKIVPHIYTQKLRQWIENSKKRAKENLSKKFGDRGKNQALIDFYIALKSGKKFEDEIKKQNQYIKMLFQNKKDIDKVFNKELGKELQEAIELQADWFAFIENAYTNSKLNNGSVETPFLSAFVNSTNVVGSTCIHIASSAYQDFDFRFDYMIMDESSKATPAETLVPLVMSRNVILIGDHKQLPPVVTREEAIKDKVKQKLEDNGLDFEKEFSESLFENLINQFEEDSGYQRFVKMLDIQYRMPRQIGWIISQFFYEGKLNNPDITLDSLKDYDQKKFHGLSLAVPKVSITDEYGDKQEVPNSIIFVSTSRQKDPYDNDNKYDRKNDCNVVVIKDILKQLNLLYRGNLQEKEPFTVGIIAGYRGQVNNLKHKIRLNDYSNFIQKDENENINELIEINTVDGFQGAERDIVIYDIVRSTRGVSNIGFLADPRRINVAFSRAKRLLIIVGDSDYILKRSKNNPHSDSETFALKEITQELSKQKGIVVHTFKEAINESK